MTMSPLNQLKALEKQKARILGSAKAELLQRIERDIEQLNELGFNYVLSDKRHAKTRANGRYLKVTSKPCSICGFETIKPHDARSHRWQKPKAAFSEKDLSDRGLRRV